MSDWDSDQGDGDEGERADGPHEGARPLIDDVFTVLADWRRREICQFFAEADRDTATVDDLAMLVAGCRPPEVRESPMPSHEEIVESLTETHLPKLAAAGVVDFDPRSGTVRYWGQPTVEKWLEHVTAVDRRAGRAPDH